MKYFSVVLGLCWLLAANLAVASEDINQFPNQLMQTRYYALIEDLRCPKCQNQNLADSNAMIAQDLRTEVKKLLLDGKSDREIEDHLIRRYGEFVLYKPRLTGATQLLWYLPLGLFLLGGVVVIIVVVQKRKPKQQASLSAEDQSRLDELLAAQNKDQQ